MAAKVVAAFGRKMAKDISPCAEKEMGNCTEREESI